MLVLVLCIWLGENGKYFHGMTSGVTIFIYSLLVTMIEVAALFPGKMRQVLRYVLFNNGFDISRFRRIFFSSAPDS
jgi:preprotein translocase subunit SecY